MMKKQTKNLFLKAVVYFSIAVFGILIVKEIVDEIQFKKELEADPYYQSVFHAVDAINLVRGRSFVELKYDERRKLMMKCTEAHALATLPSAQTPDDDEYFHRYLYGLNIVAHTHYLSENVKQLDQAIEMIKDYLYKKQCESGYDEY